MKQKDIVVIVVVIVISGVASFVISNALFGGAKNKTAQVEVVQEITSEFDDTPDEKYFNTKSENPTQVIEIDNNDNQQPFKESAR